MSLFKKIEKEFDFTTLNDLAVPGDTYANVCFDLQVSLKSSSNDIISFTYDDLYSIEEYLSENEIEVIYDRLEQLKNCKTKSSIIGKTPDENDLNIELKEYNGIVFGYEDLDGLDAFWFTKNFIKEIVFKDIK